MRRFHRLISIVEVGVLLFLWLKRSRIFDGNFEHPTFQGVIIPNWGMDDVADSSNDLFGSNIAMNFVDVIKKYHIYLRNYKKILNFAPDFSIIMRKL